MNKKKIFKDISLNMIASFLPILVLQFLVLPQIALQMPSDQYGKLLAIIALINLTSGSIGSSLNNIRLINFKNDHYVRGAMDFPVFVFMGSILSVIIFTITANILNYFDNIMNYLISISTSLLMIVATYLVVEFRLRLNYYKILIASIFLAVGYGVGYYLNYLFEQWLLFLFIGSAMNLAYIYTNVKLPKYRMEFSSYFNYTLRKLIVLIVSGVLLSSASYVDRLMIYPILGGTAVSIYYTASILGKTISLALQPFSSVFLSYLAHVEKIKKKDILKIISIVSVLGTFAFITVSFLGKSVLSILYPQFVVEALRYLKITTITSILIVSSNILNPILLRFYSFKWQLSINGLYLCFYIFLSFLLVANNGIMGFCLAALISALIKFGVMIFIIIRETNNKGNVNNITT